MRPLVLSLAVATAMAALSSARTSDPLDRAAIQRAVGRSLPLLQSSADTWFQKRECASCHHQTLGLIATTVAAERGVAGDAGFVRRQLARTLRPVRDWQERFVTGEVSINEAVGQSYRAVGVGTAGGTRTAMTDAMSYLLAGRQHRSGRWPSYSRRPPIEDSEFTATAFTIRALRLYPLPGRTAEFDERVARAAHWLRQASPSDLEDRAMQLLGLAWSGAPAPTLAPFADALLAEQRMDGGWAQIATRDADAYATGLALVALNQAARVSAQDPRFERGLRYLLATQLADGSWHVTTRRTFSEGLPYFETGYPHGKDQFISYAGAGWATTALALALGEDRQSAGLMAVPSPSGPASPVSDEPDGLTPLMRAALYGTLAEVDARLASGDDPNESSPIGVTALMCAVHDPAKVSRLLQARADPSAVTKTGHSVLSMAAFYSGAGASVQQVLARDVAVDVPILQGNLEGATPLVRALAVGELEVAAALHARGARVEASLPKGISPVKAGVWHGDVEWVRWLLGRGAKGDEVAYDPFSGGSTPLMAAVEDGRPALVAALLAAGANPNQVDGSGGSVLTYAAVAIDRGTTEIVDMLLAAGARPTPAPPDSHAPAVLARRWNKPHVAAALESAR
jgi:ankyrin repeat protein